MEQHHLYARSTLYIYGYKIFYTEKTFNMYEYMNIKETCNKKHFIKIYNLYEKFWNGYVYLKIQRCMHGIPQAGILSNKKFKKRMAHKGYYEVPHIPVLR